VVQRILREAGDGKSFRAIARGLDAGGIPCRSGRKWSHQTVGAIVRRAEHSVKTCEAARWSRKPAKMSPEWGVDGRFPGLGVRGQLTPNSSGKNVSIFGLGVVSSGEWLPVECECDLLGTSDGISLRPSPLIA
jgi:hypothetical protein